MTSGFTPVTIQMMLWEWCWLTPPRRSGPQSARVYQALCEEEEILTLPTKHQFAVIDEDQVFPTLSAAQVRSAGNLGDRPLIVLTAAREDVVSRSFPTAATKMPTEHPEVVISVIHDVWLAAH